ncbi:MAG: long-chain-acyl-CoA synthetase [Halieaceae bacterium]|jgi:fatty-acyl-CoA synthase|nr:long-chain-acyl-CoA synthetase [Halieaceae bacterium]
MNPLQILRRELSTVAGLRAVKKWIDVVDPESSTLVPDEIEELVDRHGASVAWIFEGQSWSYTDMEAFANRIANWAIQIGLEPGDAVALFMENRPEYVAIWYGLSKIGVVTGLINSNLAEESLAHCINIIEARLVIGGSEQDEALRSARGLIDGDPAVFTLGGSEGDDLEKALAGAADTRPDRSRREALLARDLCLYVYTSGTTGLPKAAKLAHARTRAMMRSFVAPCGITANDRIYITLPLYHGTGGICGVGQALMAGACIVLRRRFSASHFWDDVAEHDVTSIVYIGELCRYLVNSPPHPRERDHLVRTGFGNGLRPDIWQAFMDRFDVPHLVEFYGSTEGNVSLMNIDGKVGAVGRIPSYLEKNAFANIAFVRFDVVEEHPLRDEHGFCMRTKPDEVGEAIGRVGKEVRTRFDGYNDKAASEKKLLRDVFRKGDLWFRTGDLMKKDRDGYIYFVDRIGDTFRWKGENVSTGEVAECLARIPGITTANVYGVGLPGADGRAGMAAITTEGEVDFGGLYSELAKQLPAYAIPLFLRVQPQAATTGTFKYRKIELVKEGFDPALTKDPLWFLDAKKRCYARLTKTAHQRILEGKLHF